MKAGMTTWRYIDTHCHIDLYDNPVSVLEESEANEVGIVAVTNAPFVFDACMSLSLQHSNILPALGLHPELVERFGAQISLFEEKISQTPFVGEIGLDYVTKIASERVNQRRVFESILDTCRSQSGKFLTIHSRRAANDVISMIGVDFPGTVVLHWFSGNQRELQKAIDAGFYFSVNLTMLNTFKGRRLIERVPLDRLFAETDGPFTDGPFVRVQRRHAIPSDIITIVETLAELWCMDSEEVEGKLRENFKTATASV